MTKQMLKATLYLGASIPSGGMVSPERFADYLTHVTPHFPGFTVMEGHGYWKGQPEMTRTLVILMEDAPANRGQIRFFAEQYKTMFGQESVMHEFQPVEVALNCWPYHPNAGIEGVVAVSRLD